MDWGDVAIEAGASALLGGLTTYIGGAVPKKVAKLTIKEVTKAMVESVKQGSKKWIAGTAEEFLSNAISYTGENIGKAFRKMCEQAF